MKFKKLESGRSMVEMLGVLAIIGVLSVAGIAGSSLSMRRHRSNQIVDFISKNALIVYGECQQKLIDNTISSINECYRSKVSWSDENSDVGKLPAGLSALAFNGISIDSIGPDIVHMSAAFDDDKLCQAAASINGTTCTKGVVGFKIKQN